MTATLKIFGNEYKNVTGFKIKDVDGNELTYTLDDIPDLQEKSVTFTPSEATQYQTVTPDLDRDGLSSVEVTIESIPSTYVGSDIDRRSSSNLMVDGATIHAPPGYYAEAASKSVASGSAATPSTAITANPSISVSASGLITSTASASQSVTPTVSAGYVSSGSAGTISVNGRNTQQLATQAALTVTPTKSPQTAVAAGKYTTGAVTVSAIPDAYQDVTNVNATAADVLVGKTIVTADGVSTAGTLEVQRYYTGSSEPAASVGSDGDIYLMTGA